MELNSLFSQCIALTNSASKNMFDEKQPVVIEIADQKKLSNVSRVSFIFYLEFLIFKSSKFAIYS